VSDAIVFAGVCIRAGAHVSWSILDTDVVVGADARLGGPPHGKLPTADELVLVGRDSAIAAGAKLAPGSRLEPGTT